MNSQSTGPLTFERLPLVCKRVGVTKSTLYRWMESGQFPAPVKIGERAVAWDSRAVDQWMLDLIANAEKEAPSSAWAA